MELAARSISDEKTARLVIGGDNSYVRCTGAWIVRGIARLERQLTLVAWPETGELTLDCTALTALDTTGAWLLHKTIHALEQRGQSVKLIGLRPEFITLLHLVASCAMKPETTPAAPPNLLVRIGRQSWQGWLGMLGMLAFIGETSSILLYSCIQPRRIRWRAILHNLQTAGFEALPIVGLLSFLMGLVISYQGADQLQRFGANIFIADLVGLSMLRELSPLLTAIIVAGRSGSAYAAEIGTMKADRADHRLAAAHGFCRCHRRARRHDHGPYKTGRQLRCFPRPSRRCGQPVLVSVRYRQSPGICRDHRFGRMLSGLPGDRQCRQCRAADHGERGTCHFSGHFVRCTVFHRF
jgi:ABC-type transporter Mla MlaB component